MAMSEPTVLPDLSDHCERLEPVKRILKTGGSFPSDSNAHGQMWPCISLPEPKPHIEEWRSHLPSDLRTNKEELTIPQLITVIEFVKHKFIPEYVVNRKHAGRAHFQTILKHVLTPAGMNDVFHLDSKKSRDKLKAISDWPYMDSICLQDVTPANVQQLISKALERGYSIQTVTHIRNVIRKLFSFAQRTLSFNGENPAAKVALPEMVRREAHTLTLDQLESVIQSMRYPEREMALISILTKISIAEACGLQWRRVNLSDSKRIVESEVLEPRTIAIRSKAIEEGSNR